MDKLDNEIEKALESVPRTLHVRVTWDHIVRSRQILQVNGDVDKVTHCPIALALLDMGYKAKVGLLFVELYSCTALEEILTRWELPPLARRFIQYFDNSCEVGGFEFDLHSGLHEVRRPPHIPFFVLEWKDE